MITLSNSSSLFCPQRWKEIRSEYYQKREHRISRNRNSNPLPNSVGAQWFMWKARWKTWARLEEKKLQLNQRRPCRQSIYLVAGWLIGSTTTETYASKGWNRWPMSSFWTNQSNKKKTLSCETVKNMARIRPKQHIFVTGNNCSVRTAWSICIAAL